MELITMMKTKQREIGLSTIEFATYLGFTKSWLYRLYGLKYVPLKETTMQVLNKRIDIPYSVMEEYNRNCEQNK